jgi:hypothetical protein
MDLLDREAQPLERGCDVGRIISGVRQRRDAAVSAVADHQRDALLGVGRGNAEANQKDSARDSDKAYRQTR